MATATSSDDPRLPGGRIGERISALVDAVNARSADAVQRFIERECTASFQTMVPMAGHQDVFFQFGWRTGGVDFLCVRSVTPPRAGQTLVIAEDRNFGAWRSIALEFDEADDCRISRIEFDDATPPCDPSATELDDDELLELASSLFDRATSRDAFSGALLIARNRELLFARAHGEASKRFHAPNSIDTKFNLGSMNKMFTAVAIAQLVEAGKLHYDAPISAHVDASWLPADITDRVTIHQLLSHTSGLGSYFNDAFWNTSRENLRYVDDFKPLVQGESLGFAPGTSYQYSNTGMLLLGVIIERATSTSYYDYVRDHVFAPAGMSDTDSYEMDEPVENVAIGYIPDRGPPRGWRNNLYKHVIKGGPAGGGFSTVGDLHRFATALLDGSLVAASSREALWSDQSGTGYGYGFRVENGVAGKIVGHGGSFHGVSANLDICLDRGYVVAVLANYDGAASPIAARIKQLVRRLGR